MAQMEVICLLIPPSFAILSGSLSSYFTSNPIYSLRVKRPGSTSERLMLREALYERTNAIQLVVLKFQNGLFELTYSLDVF